VGGNDVDRHINSQVDMGVFVSKFKLLILSIRKNSHAPIVICSLTPRESTYRSKYLWWVSANGALERLARGTSCLYLDLWNPFLLGNGEINQSRYVQLYPPRHRDGVPTGKPSIDRTHLSIKGYKMTQELLITAITEVLGPYWSKYLLYTPTVKIHK